MPFESLSFRHTFHLGEVPHRWVPLICLYDPDLPLFPVHYFHVLRSDLPAGTHPLITDRAFGYVEHIRLNDAGGIDVGIVVNKDLSLPANNVFLEPVESEVRERFGINNPVTLDDVSTSFLPPLDTANGLLIELWSRVITDSYGNLLPFGRTWDAVFGLARFVASWYSPSGRKGEMIQTHYFASRFGVAVSSAGGIPRLDFYLLPTITEFLDDTNPLTDFPRFHQLLRVAELFATSFGTRRGFSGLTLTYFRNPVGGQLNTEKLFRIIRHHIPNTLWHAAFECFNAFDKGPLRTIIFLLMLNDLRHGLLRPGNLTAPQCGAMYHGLKGSYQSPKVIQIYAQQCFGNTEAIPVDTWIETFLKWPLKVYPLTKTTSPIEKIFAHARLLGKVERLIWYSVQARKVHSAACNDAIWCVKYGSDQRPQKPRGANPFGCNICLESIRRHCPAFEAIRNDTVGFNGADPAAKFQVTTSAKNNATPDQLFVDCKGVSIYSQVVDSFSPADDPSGFQPFPASGHRGTTLTVKEFIDTY